MISRLSRKRSIKLFTEVLSKLWGKSEPTQWAAYLFVAAKASFADLKLIPRPVHNAVIKYCCNVLNAPMVPTDVTLGSVGSIAGTRLSAASVLVALVAANLDLARQIVDMGVCETICSVLFAISNATVPNATQPMSVSLPASPTSRQNHAAQQPQQGQQPSLLGIENGDFAAFRPPRLSSAADAAMQTTALTTDPTGDADGESRSVVDLLEHVLLCLHLLTLVADINVGIAALRSAGRASLQALGAASPETRRAAIRCAHASFVIAQHVSHVDDPALRDEIGGIAATLAEGLLEHSRREASPLARFELCAAAAAYLSSLSPDDVRDAATAPTTNSMTSAGTLPPGPTTGPRRGGGGGLGATSPSSAEAAVPTFDMGAQGSPGPLRGSVTGIAAPTPILSSVRHRPA